MRAISKRSRYVNYKHRSRYATRPTQESQQKRVRRQEKFWRIIRLMPVFVLRSTTRKHILSHVSPEGANVEVKTIYD